MALFGSVYTINYTDKRVWITIYDLGKTRHLDYGWVDPGNYRIWQSGNYMYGSFYYVRGEVKSNAAGNDPNIYDTTIQINIQARDHPEHVRLPVGLGHFDQQVDTAGGVVYIAKGDDNYYWKLVA